MLDKLIQDNKLQILGKLTASLVHEIRNPLSAIKLNLDYLKMIEEELPPDANDSVEASAEALYRIQYLVENLLAFSRRRQNGLQLTSLNDVSNNAITILSEHSRRINVLLKSELEPELPLINIEKSVFLQIFLNLITNAIESCESGGIVSVKTKKISSNKIIWEVEDNGKGISEEEKKEIFNDFYTNKPNGTGLGLSVCKMLLENYNSNLQFESKLGEGTRFYIVFDLDLLKEQNER